MMPTHSEYDAGIEAGFDAYPDPPSIERYELRDEDPHQWPQATAGPLLDAFDRAVTKAREARRDEWTAEQHRRLLGVLDDVLCDLCRRNEAEANGLCRWCLDELRDEDYAE